MGDAARRPTVLMFPFLAHGHITPYLGLAKNLSDRGFLIYLCSTPILLVSIKKMIPEIYSGSILPVELHLPHLPDLPPHYHTTNGLPPHLHPTLRKALRMSKPNFSNILHTLKPDLLIFDFLQIWAEVMARDLHIPAIRFYNACAATSSYINFMTRNASSASQTESYPYPALRLKGGGEAIFRAAVDNVIKTGREPEECLSEPQMVLMSTSMEMEPEYIEYYSRTIGCKVVPVGILAQEPQAEESPENTEEILDWLRKKDEGSVLYISFGSEYFLTKEEMNEMAHGLELLMDPTEISFIWVLRFPKGEKSSAQDSLPHGFVKRIGERGRIVEGWAPQVRILAHPSVGGFVTHCGWNSIMESLNFAVPIIALPMHVDQPVNARFLVEKGLAVEIERGGDGKLRREEMAKAVDEAIGGENGEALKMRVKNMSFRLKMKQREEMDGAAQELTKLCGM
ncbi:unnamed protein product [Cuscuta epithymum]|uniref:Glycosyltransferase n=1 Tax=Cuscuta epithymum TaxID=186058 RepID=A0AAV0D6F3_9ASTE|nr:unnamed protein product [Cuscuta epithymum]